MTATPGNRIGLIAIVLMIVAGLATAAGLVLVNRSETIDTASFTLAEVPVEPPVFEPRGARGESPFFPLEEQVRRYRLGAEAETGRAFTGAEVAALDESVKTGLYGGTEENTCDPERLISFLYANPDLGEAWASVQGIEFNQIADYVRSLDVRILAEPANVLNHGFDPATGGAYEIDAVLDAGTAVLVDADGNIRTRCYCGNPIKTKPPQHRPPRCVTFGAQVFTMPGGNTRREGAPSDVVLTGQQATTTSGIWVEVGWGQDAEQTGWVQSTNLREHYCPSPQDIGVCSGPGAVSVYADPSEATKVGELNGAINQLPASTTISAPISRVGGAQGSVVENGFVLIRFTQASPSLQNSAWVDGNQLNISETNATECVPVAQCIDTEGPAKDRAGGVVIKQSGIYKVEFTGHFTADRSSAEVRFLDGGAVGWITNFYTPLNWGDCEADPVVDPVVKCVRDGDTAGTVWPDPMETDPMQIVGSVLAAPVTVIGDLVPTNGRVEIRIGPGGPTGWIDVALLDGNDKYCRPQEACVAFTDAVWSVYKDDGVRLAGSPGGPAFVNLWKVIVVDTSVTPADVHLLVEVNGQTGWLDQNDIEVPADRTCGDPVDVDCSVPSAEDVVAAEKARAVAGEAAIVSDAELEVLRASALSSTGSACCVVKAVYDSDAADNQQVLEEPTVVALTGTTNAEGTWYELATVYPGKWAPAVNFVDLAESRSEPPTPLDKCGPVSSESTAPLNACCVQSKVIDEDGSSTEIDPAQFAEYIGTVDDRGEFIYEMELIPQGMTIFVAPGSIRDLAACDISSLDVVCPTINGDSAISPPGADVIQCCVSISPTVAAVAITLEGTVDYGGHNDQESWEYLTVERGWLPGETFVSAQLCGVPPAVDPPESPSDNSVVPPVPADEPTTPVDEPAAPVDEPAAPVDNPGTPVDEPAAPVDEPGESIVQDDPLGELVDDPGDDCGERGDVDGDGICNIDDNCPRVANPGQENTGSNDVGDACRLADPCDGQDADGDLRCDSDDNCPATANPRQEDNYGDARGDACEKDPCDGAGDKDRDGVCDPNDNCVEESNPGQEDTFGDARGDACEKDPCAGQDQDGDRVCDAQDNCPGDPNPGQDDTYGDARGDACEEPCPRGTEAYHGGCFKMCGPDQPDLGDGCGPCRARLGDSDGDGVCQQDDNCLVVSNQEQTDSDGDGIGDACDKD